MKPVTNPPAPATPVKAHTSANQANQGSHPVADPGASPTVKRAINALQEGSPDTRIGKTELQFREAVEGGAKGVGVVANTTEMLGLQKLDPTKVGFTQSWVSGQKAGASYNFESLVQSMKADGWVGKPVDVVRMSDGTLTSIDNTRVLAARQAGIDIQANVRGFDEAITNQARQASLRVGDTLPKTWGEAAALRIGKAAQNDVIKNGGVQNWSQRFPNGSIYDPNVWP